MNNGLELDNVVLLGRTYAEYARFFDFDSLDLPNISMLDVGGGVSSFCSEAQQQGLQVLATDPIYGTEANILKAKCQKDLQTVMTQLPKVKHQYNWQFYKDIGHLTEYRTQAYQTFISHYQAHPKHYITSSLPSLPFTTNSFDVTFVSHLLFLYEHVFDYDFHRQSLLELARVTRQQIRIYPLTNFQAERSTYIERIQQDKLLNDLKFNIVPIEFEFSKNANQMLIVTV
ncbi:hypothetical protein [Candidatus Albibeggiatoa sp. nov. NOAA]|uniref:hypothetical protein n=1 Tax=Candidatus Albibeggiatoa sp. nov. NOAA TaxID=3162724 RepID=UPI0033054F3E|nr:class I SAM-dependent methyltransferase [Thiotrichaceae bacterium]